MATQYLQTILIFLNLVTKGHREIPDQGILTAGVPSAFSSIFRLLQYYGKLDFRTIAKYAKSYAQKGFPIHYGIVNQKKFGLNDLKLKFKNEWTDSYNLYINKKNS
jgi:gamma-glutamyltranspeptidase/glutathione hydrolase